MQAILCLPLLTTLDTQRLVLSSCLGTALLTLSRSPAVLGIYLGQGEEVSVSRIQWDFPPFCPWDFFFFKAEKSQLFLRACVWPSMASLSSKSSEGSDLLS